MNDILGYTAMLESYGLPIKGCYVNASGVMVEKWKQELTAEENILFEAVKDSLIDTVCTILPERKDKFMITPIIVLGVLVTALFVIIARGGSVKEN